MLKKFLYALWAGFYILCGWLGTTEPETGLQAGAMTAMSVIFFVPPAILLGMALKQGDRKTLKLLRILSICSLALTLAGLIANIAAVHAPEATGDVLYYVVLNFLSVPMLCSRHFVLSMFLWAVLLFAAIPQKKKKK